MNPYYVNVLVGHPDHNGEMSQYGCVSYRFDNWEDATNFIKLSLDNGLIVEARVPDDARDQQVV